MAGEIVPGLEHYPRPAERTADKWVHLVGLIASAIGGIVLLGLSLGFRRWGLAAAVGLYATCVVLMFLASTAYNLASPRRRPLLRRLDHAAIFLMIAGSYTPFTTQRLTGAWAIGMTGGVWAIALLAAAVKLFAPGFSRGFWVAIYLALGWVALVAIKPLIAGVSLVALVLVVLGGVIYSLGVIVYAQRSMPFRRAIWHAFVVAAAGIHFAAILIGVVLPAPIRA